MNFLNSFVLGFCFNFLLILLFCRLPVMTRGGWISAGILGTLLWGCLGWKGWISVVIYLALGSLVTRIGYKYKKEKGIEEKRGGRRGPENVWGSASTGLFFALMIKLNLGNISILQVAFAASFAAKLADTFGSEIGKRFGKNAYLITSLRKVKNGTEGAVSKEGTLASLMGSILMTYSMLQVGIITKVEELLIVSISGFMATILESYIGAKYQNKYKLTNELVNSIQTSISSIISILLCLIFSFYKMNL